MITYNVTVNDRGTKYWYLNGNLHREDGPAVESVNGGKEWYLNNKLHREDGPAIEYTDGKQWWLNDKRHREDGPAVELSDGGKAWYLNGRNLTEDEFNAKMNPKITELTLQEIATKFNIPLDQLRIKEYK